MKKNQNIEFICQKLNAAYKPDAAKIEKHEKSLQSMVQKCVEIDRKAPSRKSTELRSGLAIKLILNGKYDAAWIVQHFCGVYWPLVGFGYNNQELPLGWDVNEYWSQLQQQPVLTLVERQKLIDEADNWDYSRETMPLRFPFYELPQPPFKPDDPNYNQTKIHEACTTDGSSLVYDYRPEARHSEVPGETDQFYVTPAGWLAAADLVRLFMRLERYSDAWECLVRMQHGISWGEPPSDLIDHPRLKHMAAWTNLFWYWYLARQEADPERRQDHAWSAVYWLIEFHLRARNTEFHRDEFEVFCELVAEFRLMGERHEEFMSHFQIKAMYASVSHLRATLEHSVKMVPFTERGVPTIAEAKRIYDEMYPPDASPSK